MKLTGFKDCAKCINSISYGSKDSPEVQCNCDEYGVKELFKDNGRYFAQRCKYFKDRGKTRNGLIKDNLLKVILGGNSEFIMHSTKNTQDYQYKITRVSSSIQDIEFLYYVNIKCATEYVFAGTLYFDNKEEKFKFSQGKNGNINENNISIKSLIFVLNQLVNHKSVQYLELLHIGKCCVCGKILDTDADILCGIHSKCDKNIEIPEIIKEW